MWLAVALSDSALLRYEGLCIEEGEKMVSHVTVCSTHLDIGYVGSPLYFLVLKICGTVKCSASLSSNQ